MAIATGTRLGRYEIRSPVGAGGMGEVYLAHDTLLDRSIALKVLPAALASEPQRLHRFLQEARAASQLKGGNVAHIYDIGDAGGLRFIAMEYVEGAQLNDKINGQPLPIPEIIRIGIHIASALEEAHAKGITHRDIKPQNVIVTPEGEVKVLDFGLAKLDPLLSRTSAQTPDSEAETRVKTDPGVVMGTVLYMSPEQAMGREVDPRTDIFSLGVVLYEMAAGRVPFSGASITETIDKIAHSQPDAISRFNYSVPPELEMIIRKALRKERDERYQSVRGMIVDLKALQREVEIGNHQEYPASVDQRSTVVDASSAERPTVIDTGQQQAPRSPEAFAARTVVSNSESISSGAVTAGTTPSIAVLPLLNMSADPENEYFCDGLAEELLNALAKIEGLKVAARTSAFFFKGKEIDVREIGQKLGVGTVLEGSVRKAGNRVRITAQLIDVADGYHLWSERYDRQMEDIFDIQDEITLAVVNALKVTLLGEDKAAALKRYTDNTEAYELYLKGRHFYNKYTGEGWAKAIEYFEKAIEKEPEYAPAYAGISHCLGISWYYGILPADEALPQANAASSRAMELEHDLDEAHLSLGNAHFYHEWNWAEAEREYSTAIELNPNSADAHQWYGMFLASRERFDQAVAEGRRARELDPLSLLVNLHLGRIYLLAGRWDRALRQAQRLTEIESNFVGAYWHLGAVHLHRGMHEEALEALQQALALSENQIAIANLGATYGLLGKREEALNVLNQLLEMRERQYVTALNIARVYSGLGDKDKAFEWLERAYEERDGGLAVLNAEAKAGTGGVWVESIRTDPRFQDLARRIGLSQ
jgi:serine/threonine protein kinase/tetratricopeptide (TPR) repeat protein